MKKIVAATKRKRYLINQLHELDIKYLNVPLHGYSLVDLERLHIEEKNAPQQWDA